MFSIFFANIAILKISILPDPSRHTPLPSTSPRPPPHAFARRITRMRLKGALTECWAILFAAHMLMLGSEASPFADSAALKVAVDNCLTHNATGSACCGVSHDANCGDPATARCGAAGCDEMGVWDVSSVTTMWKMFEDATSFNADISGWDTSSVTDMRYMFESASAFNADLSSWDVSSVTTMHGMFFDASEFNVDISGWDVSSATRMSSMFYKATAFSADISYWNTSSVRDTSHMFAYATAWLGAYARMPLSLIHI